MFENLMERFRNNEEGFTLIELLVVVIIIGILSAIAIPTFLSQRRAAWEASAEADLKNLAMNFETCYATSGSYPSSLDTAAAGTLIDATKLCTNTTQQLSPGVSITAVAVANGAYQITASHSELNGATVVFDSSKGGIQAWKAKAATS